MADDVQFASAYLSRLNAAIDAACRRSECSRATFLLDHFSDEKYIAKKLSARNQRHIVNRTDHKRLMLALKGKVSDEELSKLQVGFEAHWVRHSKGVVRELSVAEIQRFGISSKGSLDDEQFSFLLDAYVERPRAKGETTLALRNVQAVRALIDNPRAKLDQRARDRISHLLLREYVVYYEQGDIMGMASLSRAVSKIKEGSAFQRRVRLLIESTYPATIFFRRNVHSARALDPSGNMLKNIYASYVELADMMREIQRDPSSIYWRLTPEALRTTGNQNVLSASAYLDPESAHQAISKHEAYLRTLIGMGPLRAFDVALYASQAALFCQSVADPDRGLTILEAAFTHAKSMKLKAGLAELNLNAAELNLQKSHLDCRSHRDEALAASHRHLSLAYRDLQDPRTHAPLRERATLRASTLAQYGFMLPST